MPNSQNKIAMLAGNGDGVNSRPKYNALGKFIDTHSTRIIDGLLLIIVTFDAFMIGRAL